jgi:ABC-type bacteriocin/lantibiotic exporter with double-glycine peptidase domain
MDCGPATLKCLLNGFGLHASYGRLREACQTDVDGTSIDTLEDLANDAGLIAEQILLPVDHVAASSDFVLPAIVVVRQPGGLLHFVVAWRRHGPVVQIMDPGTGRRWPTRQGFADEIFAHTMSLAASTWRQWAGSDLFQHGLRTRAKICGINRRAIGAAIDEASADSTWRSFATLDAALRMIDGLRNSGAFGRSDAGRVLATLWGRARDAQKPTDIVPQDYWTVRPAGEADGQEQVSVSGAVLVRVTGVRDEAERARREAALSREVVAALRERPVGPGQHLLGLLRADGTLAPLALLAALLLAAGGVVVEALLFRSLIDLGPHLAVSGQRLATMGVVVTLCALLLVLELPIARAAIGFGRRLETRLRIAFMSKIPRLADRYFHSRPSSDMAERCHAAHQIRDLPLLGAQLVRSTFELLLTTAAIAVLFPASAPLAIAAAAFALVFPLLAQPWLNERDLRQRTHTGALTRFYLDAFLGLVAIRAHGAERALAREQESLLVEWAGAGRALLGAAVATSAAQLTTGFGFAAWLLYAHLRQGDEGAGALLLAYWALNIPVLGQEIAQVAWQYPAQRNLTLRLLEPLGALEEEGADAERATPAARSADGVSIELQDVSVRAAGHLLLEGASLTIAPGAHVAIVGPSGAGKSTLVGLLLGWHRPSAGSVIVDGRPLDPLQLDELRRDTVWVDPAVQLWNRSLIENLEFGSDARGALPIGTRVREAELRPLIEQLPEGLQTRLGEGGALVSGGEGQRVRFGRGLGRQQARLVILDEPFRGLERNRRAALLARARDCWRNATLICITHDIGETASFERVVVLAEGRIAEDGDPPLLAGSRDSRYRALLDAESALRLRLWSDPSWRTLQLRAGKIVDDCRHEERVTV